MVFIHGGGFTLGSSSDIEYNPIPLAVLGDVIVVTINYRLSVFGFFTTGESIYITERIKGCEDSRMKKRLMPVI